MNVIFFDGICIMCSGFLSFISEKDVKNGIFFVILEVLKQPNSADLQSVRSNLLNKTDDWNAL